MNINEQNMLRHCRPNDTQKGRNQKQWMDYWKNKGDFMLASMGDYYSWFKLLRNLPKHDSRLPTAFAHLYSDLIKNRLDRFGIMSSTRWIYSLENIDATIVNDGFYQADPHKDYLSLPVPAYDKMPIDSCVRKPSDLYVLQTLLETDDSGEDIVEIFEYIRLQTGKRMLISTLPLIERDDGLERAVALINDHGNVLITDISMEDKLYSSRGKITDPVIEK